MSTSDASDADGPGGTGPARLPRGNPCVGFALRRASRAATQVYDAALSGTGLRITQFSILGTLVDAAGPRRISDLARDLMMDRTTLTRNLRPLERRGFITVDAGDDRRERWARLTEDGLDQVRAAYPHWRTAQDLLLSLFGSERWRDIEAEVSAALSEAINQVTERKGLGKAGTAAGGDE